VLGGGGGGRRRGDLRKLAKLTAFKAYDANEQQPTQGRNMQAIRETLDVIDGKVVVQIPSGFSAGRVDIIVLPATSTPAGAPAPGGRQPSRLLAGTRITGDIMAPVLEADDWQALR